MRVNFWGCNKLVGLVHGSPVVMKSPKCSFALLRPPLPRAPRVAKEEEGEVGKDTEIPDQPAPKEKTRGIGRAVPPREKERVA